IAWDRIACGWRGDFWCGRRRSRSDRLRARAGRDLIARRRSGSQRLWRGGGLIAHKDFAACERTSFEAMLVPEDSGSDECGDGSDGHELLHRSVVGAASIVRSQASLVDIKGSA